MRQKNRRHYAAKLITALIVFLLAVQPTAWASGSSDGSKKLPARTSETGEYIVKMAKSSSALSAKSLPVASGADLVKVNKQQLLMKLDKATEEETLASLAANPNVEYIEPNIRMHSFGNISDPKYSEQWGLQEIGAEAAWDEAKPASNVIVAVIDTGVDYTHPDLSDRVDTRNDYDYVNRDSSAMDDNGHGTHVAGIIAAELNKIGIAGAAGAADVTILPLKVLDSRGEGTMYDVATAIMDAADLGADVINLSVGGYWDERYDGKPRTMTEAVEYAMDKGAVVIAAAGNESDDTKYYIPASISDVITVSAVDEDLEFTDFSNYGFAVDIAAPGENILSTWPGGDYEYADGTSMATPFVSGIAALLKAQNDDLDADELTELLLESATDIGDKGKDELYGYGLLNASKAVDAGAGEDVDGAPAAELEKIKPSVKLLLLKPNAQAQIIVDAYYEDGTKEDVTSDVEWSSSNTKVATVEDGVVTAHQAGTAIIMAKYGGKTEKITVEIRLTRLTISPAKLLMKPDGAEEITLTAVYGTQQEEVTEDAAWKTSNSSVAAYEDGKIVTKGFGRATITASYGGKSARVIVDTTLKSLKLDTTKKSLQAGDTYTPELVATYRDDSDAVVTEDIEWVTSNKKVATVDDDGKITAIAKGRAKITARYGGKSAAISITVTE